jgi:hypothetical protein
MTDFPFKGLLVVTLRLFDTVQFWLDDRYFSADGLIGESDHSLRESFPLRTYPPPYFVRSGRHCAAPAVIVLTRRKCNREWVMNGLGSLSGGRSDRLCCHSQKDPGENLRVDSVKNGRVRYEGMGIGLTRNKVVKAKRKGRPLRDSGLPVWYRTRSAASTRGCSCDRKCERHRRIPLLPGCHS